MEQKLGLYILCVVNTIMLVLLLLFTFGFCIPVIEDYKTQLDILENRGCKVSYDEYIEWRNKYDE